MVMEVERKVIVLSCVVCLLGLLSAATAFAAEVKRIKIYLHSIISCGYGLWKEPDQVKILSSYECTYPEGPALGLGLTSAVALMIAQIIINVATGCVCCRKGPHQSNADWSLALTCFVVSWFAFVVAFLLLLSGAALNSQHTEDNFYFGYCCVVKPGLFCGAAVLSLLSVILGIIYYLTLSSAKNTNNRWGPPVLPPPTQGGIAMGQPQIPSQGPVFVHEDTYMRRQEAL